MDGCFIGIFTYNSNYCNMDFYNEKNVRRCWWRSRSQIFSIGKSKAKLFDENSDIKITFKDVAGLEGAKEEVQEIVDFLKNPKKYTILGGKIPKGALLVGQPGTGKLFLLKLLPEKLKFHFSLSGSDFVEMFVGVGASRVRDLLNKPKINHQQ